MPFTLGVHVSIDGPGDGLVSAPHLVHVDHRCLLAVMPHASHEILDARRAAVAIIESLPGLGPVLGAEFLVGTNGDLTAFGRPAKLAAFAGLAPTPRDSGRISGNFRKPERYHHGLRRVFFMAALYPSMHRGQSKTFYQRKRAEGKHHLQALIALARRVVDVLWAVLRDNRPFTPAAPDTAAFQTAA